MKTPINIKKLAKESNAFRNVMDTGKFGQLVLISLRKGESLGDEIHPATDHRDRSAKNWNPPKNRNKAAGTQPAI